MKRKYTTLFAALAVLVTLGLSACGSSESPEADDAPATEVRLEQARWTVVPKTHRYAGTVEGNRKVTLGTKIMGRITYLEVEEGDPVQRGQPLVRIQSQDVEAQQAQVEAQVRQAEAALENAATNYRRMETLYQAESATKKEYEEALLAYEAAQAQVNALQARLREVEDALGYAVIRAPMAGYVVRKQAEAGDLATPGQSLLVVEDTRRLKVVAQVPEGEVDRIAVGDTVAVEVDAAGPEPLRGLVEQVNPSAYAGSRQFDVRVALRGGAGVKPGMYATVALRKGARRLIAVPEEALVQRGQLTGLFTINHQNEALLRWVRTGRRYDGRVEILSGLTDGERYVVSASGRLRDGHLVTVLQ